MTLATAHRSNLQSADLAPTRSRAVGTVSAAHRGRPDGLLVHVHALLALQTGRQLLVRAVGDLFDQLETLFHLAGRKDAAGRR